MIARTMRREAGYDTARVGAAADSADLLARLRAERAALVAALDVIDDPMVLLDRSGVVVRANRAAHDLLESSRVIRAVPGGRLAIADVVAHRAFTEAFRRLLRQVGTGASAIPPAVERMPLPRPASAPLMLSLCPVRTSGAPAGCSDPAVVLRIQDPEAGQADRIAALQHAYGLTPAEVRLVTALNEGLTLREFAAHSGLTYETVRSYVKRVLSRVGARSQADLMRFTGGMPGAWRGEHDGAESPIGDSPGVH